MSTRRIDHVTVATEDAAGALETFRTLFDFSESAAPGARALSVGDARIEFVTPPPGSALAQIFASTGEGMAELCLEVEDLDAAAAHLERAGVAFTREGSGSEARVRVSSAACHGVPLTLQAAGRSEARRT